MTHSSTEDTVKDDGDHEVAGAENIAPKEGSKELDDDQKDDKEEPQEKVENTGTTTDNESNRSPQNVIEANKGEQEQVAR